MVSHKTRIRCGGRGDVGCEKQSQDCIGPYYYLGYSCIMFIIGVVVVLLVCLSGSHKAAAQNHLLSTKCPGDTFPCVSDGKCLNRSYLCNNMVDCADGSDEGHICDQSVNKIWNTMFKKPNDTKRQSNSTDCVLLTVPVGCECVERTKLFCNQKSFLRVPSPISNRTTDLRLSLNSITEISKEQFEMLPELQVLNLDQTYLTAIGLGTFANNHKLRVLYLNINYLTNFSSEIFSAQNVVQEIYIQGNKLTAVHEGDFTNMNSLLHLDLSKNKISTIQENAFGVLPVLETL
ncbi:hypothetical protein BsWGS_28140 [Bradybaena similaris]